MNDRNESAQSDLAQVFCNWAAQEKFWVHSAILNVTFPVGSSREKSADWHVNKTPKCGKYTASVFPLLYIFMVLFVRGTYFHFNKKAFNRWNNLKSPN